MYHIIKPDDHLHGTNGNTPRNRMSIVDDNKLNSITNGTLIKKIFLLIKKIRSVPGPTDHVEADHPAVC